MTEFEDAELTRWYLAQQEAMSSLRDDVATSPATLARALDPEYRIRPHIRAIADAFLELRDHDQGKEGYDRILITTPPQIGKMCSDDTPVPTSSGWRRHGDLRVGDEVMHPSGTPTRVVAVHEPDMASMVVRTRSGAELTVHPRHEWTVYDRNQHQWDTLETQELMYGRRPGRGRGWNKNSNSWGSRTIKLRIGGEGRGGRWRFQLPWQDAFDLRDADLPVDPYTLGVWLGDGSTAKPAITHDSGDVYELPYPITAVNQHATTGVLTTHYGGGMFAGLLALGVATRDYGVRSKHIPDLYLRASDEQRWDLLCGLVDSDGTISAEGQITISGADQKLMYDVAELVRTFGYRPTVRAKPPTTSSSGIVGTKWVYTVQFTPHDGRYPARLKRKLEGIRQGSSRVGGSVLRRRDAITSVEYCDPRPGRCITVAADDGLYLVGEHMVPTHNSITAAVWAPLWWLIHHPRHRIVVSSYSGLLAMKRGRSIRDLIADQGPRFGLQLAKAPRAADDWSLTTGGGCRSVGVGGGLTGHSADCVTGDSEIATSRGRMSMSELCRLPEFPDVLSWDHDHGRAEFRAVQATQNVAGRRVVEVATRVGRALRCTPDHRVYVPGRGYVPAGDLQRGDPLLGIDADDSVEQVRIGESETVYDLQVEGNRNFFADSLLVHNCLICDDPIQDREQAESLGQRDKIDDWWSSVAMTRLSPGAPAILILTRWHPDDLAGRLLDREGRVEEGGRWKVVHIPAVANLGLTGPDVLGREDGAPLTHPKVSSHDKSGLERHWTDKRNSVSMRDWHALFQGDPKPAEGQLVSPELLRARRHIPPDPAVERQRYGVAVDPAGGGRDLAGVIGGWLGTDGRLYLSHDSSRNGYSTTWAREAALLCAEQEADFVIFEKSGLLDRPAIGTAFDSAWTIVQQLHAGTVEPDEFTDQAFLDRVRALEQVPAKPQIKTATARKGKLLRAEPIAQQWADDRLRTSTYLVDVEGEWTSWLPTDPESPGRIDASVYLAYAMLPIPGSEANVSVATAHTRDEVVMEAQRRQAQRRPAQPQMATRIQRPPMRPGG